MPQEPSDAASSLRKIDLAGGQSNCIQLNLDLSASPCKESQGREAWLLDIFDKDGRSIITWGDEKYNLGLHVKQLGGEGNPALLLTPSLTVSIKLPVNSKLYFFCHPWSSAVEFSLSGAPVRLELYSPVGRHKVVDIEDVADLLETGSLSAQVKPEELKWVKAMRAKAPAVISVLHPDWRGVRSATENLVPDRLLLADTLNVLSAKRYAQLLVSTGCTKFIFGGFPLSYEFLAREIRYISRESRVFVFWLSSFLQSNEDYAWYSFLTINRLCKEGVVEKIGFAKKGMAETVGRTGVKTGFIASYVRKIPEKSSVPKLNGPHIGIWALAPIWRKTPYAMIAASVLVNNAKVFMVGQELRAQDFAHFLGVNVTFQVDPIPQEEMEQALSLMDINLYVTLSECSPMLPLESLAAGVPCLFGPTSHLFEDHSYLHSRLVVPYPDRSDVIGTMIHTAIDEREQIINEYIEYATGYNEYCNKTLREFLH
ncbi:MAG: hypothetical protein BA863_04995 [Desulfovibrio sp. S3730MH75]|nr:MAG: hypothetical protein BA863_04995 [Desulfovibrio sp. S3730MH75]